MFSRILLTTIVLFFGAIGANAATLTVTPGNIVTGATGIIDGGASYDVVLIDGRCDTLFGGCDEDADFAPLEEADFDAVGRVLTTFFTEIDSNPLFDQSNIFGCGNAATCQANTPVYFNETTGRVITALVQWNGTNIGSGEQGFDPGYNVDWASLDTLVWARVSGSVAPVPLPAALPLFAGGLGLLGLLGWRRKRMAEAS